MPAITNVNELQDMNNDLAGTYWLTGDIDASATVGWNGGAGFLPIGRTSPYFTGVFDGRGHTVSDLYIDRGGSYYIGLFGRVATGTEIKRVNLIDADIYGGSWVGGLVGRDDATGLIVTKCSVTGSISAASSRVGGLIGLATAPIITLSYADCTVAGGGAGSRAGGFIGHLLGGTVSQCYGLGDVDTGNAAAGGFVGELDGGTISDCYARAEVGNVAAEVGGFVGLLSSGLIIDSYSTGSVDGASDVGGFCGINLGTITDCFWDTQTSGQALSDGGTGKTTAQMKTKSTFTAAGWDFIVIWFIHSLLNDGYPCFWASPPEPLPDAPRRTVAVQDKITLESVRNVEMAARGRFYVDREGNAVYKSRYGRNP